MDLSIFNLYDPSGKYRNKKYMLKNHTKEYNFINDRISSNISFKEKVYLYLHDLKNIPKCKNPKCDNNVRFRNSTLGYREYCSRKCISNDPGIKRIKEEKSYKKYGTRAPAQSNEIKSKVIKTNQERYGGSSPMCSKEIQEKSKQTLLKNWGVENPNHSKELSGKRIKSFKNNIEQYKENYKKTSFERYGVEHPWMKPEIHNKSIIKSSITKNKKLKKSILKKLDNNYELININYNIFNRNIFIKHNVCNEIFEINREQLHKRYKAKTLICTHCNPIDIKISGAELNLLQFIKNNYKGEVITNNRTIISPYEIDIYIPELKLAFEYNGLYWHSEDMVGKKYHYEKTMVCRENDIELIHIWEDDWINKTHIIKSIIKNKLNSVAERIYARKCIIKSVDKSMKSSFYLDNHILGDTKSKINIGLFHNDKLMALMSFNKTKTGYNLVRYVNRINTIINGGFSKLFKYFIKNYEFDDIITYSDNSMFNGSVYKSVGFENMNESKLSYSWVIDKQRVHKFNFRKKRLEKMGLDIKDRTEYEIMTDDLNSYRIWDCGLTKWKFSQKISRESKSIDI